MTPLPLLHNIEITAIAAQGMAIARADGMALFVPFAAVGDVLDVQIVRRRRDYMEGRIARIIKTSLLRVQPICQHYGVCGGCKWQHLPYAEQLRWKRQQVVEQLRRIGGIEQPNVLPIIGSERTAYYRNKLEYTFCSNAWRTSSDNALPPAPALGFHVPGRFDKALNIEHCHLQGMPSNAIRNALRRYAIDNDYSFYDPKTHQGLLRNLIIRISGDAPDDALLLPLSTKCKPSMSVSLRRLLNDIAQACSRVVSSVSHDARAVVRRVREQHCVNVVSSAPPSSQPNGSEVMAAVVFAYEDMPKINSLMAYLNDAFPQIASLQYIINRKSNDDYADCTATCYSGKEYITERLGGLQFRIGLKSFFQTNSAQAVRLYEAVQQMSALTGDEVVYDMYCGTGTIGCCLARQARRIVGIDIVPQAIDDACANARLNGIANTDFLCADIKDALSADFSARYGAPDVIVVDPPRAGLHPNVVQALLRMLPRGVVYVSCNPATQARDLGLLSAAYTMHQAQPVDMFPHTQHVECVVRLSRRNEITDSLL